MAVVNSSRVNLREGIEWAVKKQLEVWGSDVLRVTQEEIPGIAKETAQRLRKVAPRRKKGGGKYAKGWTYKVERGRLSVGATIYGKHGTYQLAHLLENGHARRGGGRNVDAIVHIKPVEEWAIEELMDRVVERLEGL